MLSGCIEYKDLRSEKHTYKSEIGSKRIENPYTQFRQIFRCAQQHVQISRYISLVATYPSAREAIVLADMLSGCIEYKDLRSEKHTYKS